MDGSQEPSEETKVQNRTYLRSLDNLQVLYIVLVVDLYLERERERVGRRD
jgi:hypothetical protein